MTPLVDPAVETSQVTSQIAQLDNRPPEPPQAIVEPTPMETPTIVVESPSRPNTSQREIKFNPLKGVPAPKEQVQSQSVKTTFQAKQLDKPAYTGLPTDLIAPYAEGSLEALAANKRRMEEEGFELRMVFNDQTKQWESKYLPKSMGPTKVTSPTNLQREQLSTIYDSILEKQNQKYSKLITELPTMEDSMLENLVVVRESFPYEIRMMILDEYKTRINYYDRIRNPQNYPGEPSPILPKMGTTLPTIEGDE